MDINSGKHNKKITFVLAAGGMLTFVATVILFHYVGEYTLYALNVICPDISGMVKLIIRLSVSIIVSLPILKLLNMIPNMLIKQITEEAFIEDIYHLLDRCEKVEEETSQSWGLKRKNYSYEGYMDSLKDAVRSGTQVDKKREENWENIGIIPEYSVDGDLVNTTVVFADSDGRVFYCRERL